MKRRDFLCGTAALAGGPVLAATPAAAAAAGPDVTCRLTVMAMPDQDVPALRVISMAWDSGFRGAGLRIGDQILAVDGAAVSARPGAGPQHALGSTDEAKAWAAEGRRADGRVSLTIRRRLVPGSLWQTLSVTGALRPESHARNARNDPVLGPGGPPEMFENDGFASSWGAWYEQEFQPLIQRNLDDPFCALAQTTRLELKRLLEHGPRVELLVRKYPGPFARAAREDYDAALGRLQGEKIDLAPEALRWRREEDERVQQVSALARAAWDASLAASGAMPPPFPAIDPSRQDRKPLVGKRVVLPPLRNRDWITDTGRSWFAAGSPDQGYYFLDAEAPETAAALTALERYRRVVAPNIDESYTSPR